MRWFWFDLTVIVIAMVAGGFILGPVFHGQGPGSIENAWALDDLSDGCLEEKEIREDGRMTLHMSGQHCWVRLRRVRVAPGPAENEETGVQ